MPNWDAFWGGRGKAASLWDDPNRAVDVAQMIQDQPTSVTLNRAGTAQSAQTVLATTSGSSWRATQGPAGQPSSTTLVLIGVQNHPTLADFNVQKGDRFRLWNTNWTVMIVKKLYEQVIEAHCEGQQ